VIKPAAASGPVALTLEQERIVQFRDGPVVVIAGQVHLGRREWGAAGIAGAYAVAERPDQVEAALADPAGTLAARTERVARTWSR